MLDEGKTGTADKLRIIGPYTDEEAAHGNIQQTWTRIRARGWPRGGDEKAFRAALAWWRATAEQAGLKPLTGERRARTLRLYRNNGETPPERWVEAYHGAAYRTLRRAFWEGHEAETRGPREWRAADKWAKSMEDVE
ncbi:hypothetical protein [Paenirhodobacter populi]|uniref:Uncharacterized protein n=1 Tax=Paenirhodobacter populi TaxID=2306993 RepID=A0A443IJ86_9RHOB|nr:hypothetical protein [Sinirhodobacter populi]RWR04481.1 hypothetical protein D2T33_21000 [Sinirhodobacter populi]